MDSYKINPSMLKKPFTGNQRSHLLQALTDKSLPIDEHYFTKPSKKITQIEFNKPKEETLKFNEYKEYLLMLSQKMYAENLFYVKSQSPYHAHFPIGGHKEKIKFYENKYSSMENPTNEFIGILESIIGFHKSCFFGYETASTFETKESNHRGEGPEFMFFYFGQTSRIEPEIINLELGTITEFLIDPFEFNTTDKKQIKGGLFYIYKLDYGIVLHFKFNKSISFYEFNEFYNSKKIQFEQLKDPKKCFNILYK